MVKFTCPICDREFNDLRLRPHVPSTSWSDDCCCCDQNFCVAHQIHSHNAPERPSDEVLLQRAEVKAQEKKKILDDKIEEMNSRYEQLKRLSDLMLEIKEYFGWSFETLDEFKCIMQTYKENKVI